MTNRRDNIKALAARDFAGHMLTRDDDANAWRCATPGTGGQAFWVGIVGHRVIVTGDTPDGVLCPYEYPLGFVLHTCTPERIDYPDYTLGKLSRSGGSWKTFDPELAGKYTCEDWSESALWIWHALQCFARLYRESVPHETEAP